MICLFACFSDSSVCMSVCFVCLSACLPVCLFVYVCLYEYLQNTTRLDAKKNTLVLLVKERGIGMRIDRYLGRLS